jgi:hypothetical protein
LLFIIKYGIDIQEEVFSINNRQHDQPSLYQAKAGEEGVKMNIIEQSLQSEVPIKKINFFKRTYNFFKRIVLLIYFVFWKLVVWPWRKIPKVWRYWYNGTADWKYRAMAALLPFIAMFLLFVGPLLTGYPAVWIGTYGYNYHSVIYPQEIVLTKTDEGKAIVKTIAEIIENGMLKNWQPNDLIISSSKTPVIGVDNPRNFQLGELPTIRRATEELREHMSRNGTNDGYKPPMVNAFNFMANDSDSWMIPSAEGKYQGAADSLKTYLASGATIYTTSYNLDKLLEKLSAGMAESSQRLLEVEPTKALSQWTNTADTIAATITGKNAPIIPFNQWDDVYYRAQGNIYVTLQLLRAASVDFQSVLHAKQLDTNISNIIKEIEENVNYLKDPILVVNGEYVPSNCAPLAQLASNTSNNLNKLRNQLTN